ncbi:hypothetical protein XENOCAPTIV_024399 [Xenoophorus captivus]|uniref:Uncharacterized protein n=1 Tax=Xenoophorus captivus TaxID=1517983 RepID=A0ABV0QXM4_9TELE
MFHYHISAACMSFRAGVLQTRSSKLNVKFSGETHGTHVTSQGSPRGSHLGSELHSERRWSLRMGLCLGTEDTEEEKKARVHSAKIDRDLYEYAKREMNVVKILILGETDHQIGF